MTPRSVKTIVPVRFRDQDMFAHVNHAVFLSYLEEGRVAYFRALHAPGPMPKWDFIMARVEIDYLAQVRLGDDVEVEIVVSRVGNSSYDFDYRCRRARDGALVAKAKTVQVWLDYGTGKPVPIPGDVRKRFEAYQGAIGPLPS